MAFKHHWLQDNSVGHKCVIELGAGFCDNLTCAPKDAEIIAIDICGEYLEDAKFKECIMIKGDMRNYRRLWPIISNKDLFDCVWLIDSIEHLPKEDAIILLGKCQDDFNKILVKCPDGFVPQVEDDTGYGYDEYQKHRSSWIKEDFEKLGFQNIIIKEKYRIFEGKEYGAIFAIWTKPQN